MSTIIIVIAVIVLAVLLVVRSKQAKEKTPTKQTKSATSNAKRVNKAKAEPVKAEPVKPAIDVSNVISQIDALIIDKQYAKAEGIINQALNTDSNLHALYPKLLDVYKAQDDEFAIKQLLDTVQTLNLNEVYQYLYNDFEAFKDEKQKAFQAKLSGKTPDIIEYVAQDKSNASLSDFDTLSTATPAQHIETIDFDHLFSKTQTPATTNNDQESPLETAHHTPPPVQTDEPVLEFKLGSFTSDSNDHLLAADQEFELKLDPTADHSIADRTHALEFNLEAPDQTNPTLEFKVEDISLDAPSSTIGLENNSNIFSIENTQANDTAHAEIYADINDPIIQAFPNLAQINPIVLDIELAEQYINLGEYQAAQNMLNIDQTLLSEQQAEKVQQLLQKVAS